MKIVNPNDRLKQLLKSGWKVQTYTYKLSNALKRLGFSALYHISNGEEIIGFYI